MGPPPGSPYAQGPGGPGSPKKSKTGLIIGLVLALLVVAGAVVGGILLVNNSDDDSASDTTDSSETPSPDESETPESPESPDIPDGVEQTGAGYTYVLPGPGWQDATEEALASSPGGAIDTVSILGPSLDQAQSNILVETGPTGGETDVTVLQPTWETNLSGSDGAVPSPTEGVTIDGEEAVGVTIERVNAAGLDISQIAYLVIHDDAQYSIALSFPKDDTESEADFEDALASWTWTS